jgi:hypothetical protein
MPDHSKLKDGKGDESDEILRQLVELPDLQTALTSDWYARPANAVARPDREDDDESDESVCSEHSSGADFEWDFVADEVTPSTTSESHNLAQKGVNIGPLACLASDIVRELIAKAVMKPVRDEIVAKDATDTDSDFDPAELEEMSRAVIWDSPTQRDNALKRHRDASRNKSTPGIFNFGVRYMRFFSGAKTDAKRETKCRTVLITNLPDTVELGAVLAQLRGENIIKAHIVKKHKGFGTGYAIAYFSKQEDACANVAYYGENKMVFKASFNSRVLYEAVVTMPETDTYPLADGMEIALQNGRTRHLEFDHTEPSSILAAMHKAGLGLEDFGDVVTGLQSEEFSDCYQVEFRSIFIAGRVYEEFVHLNKGSMATSKFIKDSCNGPFVEDLSSKRPLCPSHYLRESFRLMMLDREGEEPAPKSALHLRIHDPLALSWESEGKVIVDDHNIDMDDKTANWAGSHIKREEGRDHLDQLGIWEHDPYSHARQFRPYLNGIGGALGYPTMLREDWVKEYLHYNMDSKNLATRQAIDKYFDAHGLINLRRVKSYVEDRFQSESSLQISTKA